MLILNEQENDTIDHVHEDIEKFTQKLNTHFYKQIISDLNQKISL